MTVSLIGAGIVVLAAFVLVARATARVPTSIADPRPFPGRRRGKVGEPDELELAVRLGHRYAGDAHLRLRPVLRVIASGRLSRRGVDLDAEPGVAAELLGPALFDLVRPDRDRPSAGLAPGVPLVDLDDHLRRLEAL